MTTPIETLATYSDDLEVVENDVFTDRVTVDGFTFDLVDDDLDYLEQYLPAALAYYKWLLTKEND